MPLKDANSLPPLKWDEQRSFSMNCAQPVKSVAQQAKELRKHAERLEQQEENRRKAEKRARKQAKRAAERRRYAITQLMRLSLGNDQAAVEAARELLYYVD